MSTTSTYILKLGPYTQSGSGKDDAPSVIDRPSIPNLTFAPSVKDPARNRLFFVIVRMRPYQ